MNELDLPAGPPLPGTSKSFITPLQELETQEQEKRRKDLEEVDRFFHGEPPVVSDDLRDAIIKRVLPVKSRDDAELFSAWRKTDDPDARVPICRKIRPCGHPCQESHVMNLREPCDGLCTAVKTIMRECGHEAHIYCSRQKPRTMCKEKCSKHLFCGHKCRFKCHYGTVCEPTCEDFYCKTLFKDKQRDAEVNPTKPCTS